MSKGKTIIQQVEHTDIYREPILLNRCRIYERKKINKFYLLQDQWNVEMSE